MDSCRAKKNQTNCTANTAISSYKIIVDKDSSNILLSYRGLYARKGSALSAIQDRVTRTFNYGNIFFKMLVLSMIYAGEVHK